MLFRRYVWSNPSTKLSSFTSIRNGTFCRISKVKTSASAKVQTLRRNSFAFKGPQLFNKMPQCIRDLSGCTTAEFKKELDEVLRMYPDEPRLQGMGCFSSSESNSLLHVKKKGYRDNSVQRTALQWILILHKDKDFKQQNNNNNNF